MKFKEKKERKKKKWEWIFELVDVIEILGQILSWLLRGIFHLIFKILE